MKIALTAFALAIIYRILEDVANKYVVRTYVALMCGFAAIIISDWI